MGKGCRAPLWTEFSFKVLPLNTKYIQILHVDDNNWISFTNVDGNLGYRYTNDRVMVYDSFVSKKFSLNTIKQICCIIRPVSNIRVDMMTIMRQHNISDCGLFSIACATELAFGFNRDSVCGTLLK